MSAPKQPLDRLQKARSAQSLTAANAVQKGMLDVLAMKVAEIIRITMDEVMQTTATAPKNKLKPELIAQNERMGAALSSILDVLRLDRYEAQQLRDTNAWTAFEPAIQAAIDEAVVKVTDILMEGIE